MVAWHSASDEQVGWGDPSDAGSSGCQEGLSSRRLESGKKVCGWGVPRVSGTPCFFVFKGRPWFVGDERFSPASVSRPESSTALRCGSHGKGTMGGFGGGVLLAGGSPR